MDEHGYIRSVHRHVTSPTYKWKINDNYAGGVADVYYDDDANFLFAEYKYIKVPPKRATTMLVPDCSAQQLLWLRERFMRNKPTVVIMGTPLGGIVFTDLSWETGISRADLEKYALPIKSIARIILDHCRGISHVDTDEQTYPNCNGPRTSQAPEGDLDAA